MTLIKKINVLIISVYFPPIESIASHRIYSFAKYLDKEKFNIIVHTIDTGKKYDNDLDNVEVIRVKNDSLLKPLNFDKKSNPFIHYSKAIYNKFLNIFLNDPYKGWIKNSKDILKKTIKEKNIDVIVSSFSPSASHKLALSLKKDFPHIKWIADMRDEMGENPFLTPKERKKLKKLEKEIFRYCDALTSVSKPILEDFCNNAGDRKENIKFVEIRNGFDFEIDTSPYKKNKLFTISYVGTFYGKRNPSNFFEALLLIDKEILQNIKVKFVGLAKPLGIPDKLKPIVEVFPKVNHEEAVQIMKKSDALLLIHPKMGKGVYTGKLFEYLGSLRPIIALVDKNDVAAQLIKEANAGYVADFDNINEIKETIIQAFKDWKENKKFDFNIDLIKKHHRKEQVKKLENLILELLSDR